MTEADFLLTIAERPADDVALAVFADWLDENGAAPAERVEHLRIHAELARWAPDVGRRTVLWERSRELEAAHAEAWLGTLDRWANSARSERGLVRVTLKCHHFIRRAFSRTDEDMLLQA